MKNNFSIHLLVLLTAIGTFTAKAQTFEYALATDSAAYTDLSSPTVLASGYDWSNTNYKIINGFSFPCMGINADSLFVETNGFLVFHPSHDYAMATCKFWFAKQDTNGTWSTLSYQVSGTSGHHILKLQFKNVGFYTNEPTELFNFQVWLYEASGNIEIHFGPNPTDMYILNEQPTLVGMVNMNQSTPVTAFLASGSPIFPTGTTIYNGDPLVYVYPLPYEGKIYIFTPTN